jgi:hypothetical protein
MVRPHSMKRPLRERDENILKQMGCLSEICI